MDQVGKVQLILLKIFYLSIGLGFSFLVTLDFSAGIGTSGNLAGIGKSIILSLVFLCLLGFFQPLKMLLLLLFSVAWKSIWIIVFVIPAYLGNGPDEFTKNILLPVCMGLIVTAALIPWRYVANLHFATRVRT